MFLRIFVYVIFLLTLIYLLIIKKSLNINSKNKIVYFLIAFSSLSLLGSYMYEDIKEETDFIIGISSAIGYNLFLLFAIIITIKAIIKRK